MQVIFQPEQKVPIKAWVDGVELEDEARAQLVNVSKMPFIFKHVAVMPDVHAGIGATVGSVIVTKGAVMPAAVGVDIGCGMVAYQTSLTGNDLPLDLGHLRASIEKALPHGRTDNGGRNDRGAWHDLPAHFQTDTTIQRLLGGLDGLRIRVGGRIANRWDDYAVLRQLGTMGGGNHFAEVCLDEQNRVWIMLHSGSRGIGNAIGTEFIERAQKTMKQYLISLPHKDLAYIPEGTPEFKDYVDTVGWAQDYAHISREQMLLNLLGVMEREIGKPVLLSGGEIVNCHHNYVARENHFGQNVIVTRKGAVRAREGDLAIIPGAMGRRSYIVRGLGNPDSFTSCSHGAGRRMSRGKAKATITLEDHARETAGVECRKDADVLDESPGAYKDIDAVIEAQKDLVKVEHTLKAVLCVKG